MIEKTTTVAVYGSLKKGFGNHRLLAHIEANTKDVVQGFDMYSLGGFPGIKKGEGSIAVELYEVDDTTLSRLDSLEGYRKGADNTFYDRLTVTTDSGAETLIYVYMGQVDESRKVEGEVATW